MSQTPPNMKSISTDYVYHHLYDFGTTGLFVGLGKEHMEPVVNEATGELEAGKVLRVGLVIDERICDGFYYAKAIKVAKTAKNDLGSYIAVGIARNIFISYD